MRVLVANEPRFFRECLALAIATEPGCEVAIELPNNAKILRSARRFRADCVIVTLDKPEQQPRICQDLLARCPEAHVVAVGRQILLKFWLEEGIRSSRMVYSLDAILDLLRDKGPDPNSPRNGTGRTGPHQPQAM